jgi:endoglycosylceramidase
VAVPSALRRKVRTAQRSRTPWETGVFLSKWAALVVALIVVAVILVETGPAPPTLPRDALTGPVAPISSPGGPYLFDRYGRVVLLHGVNAVYKRPPYELYPAPGEPWSFTAADAARIARLGFNVVRLGITWAGLEPGAAPMNDPAICSPGAPGNPHQYNKVVLDQYLSRLRRTVEILGRFHIYTLLDMHQDVYGQPFGGEGAPPWAVCTNGTPFVDPPGRWSQAYSAAAVDAAYADFWNNDVVGNLQGQFDQMWADVARYFRSDPWVIGYDPYNEPFSQSINGVDAAYYQTQLECFYLGRVVTEDSTTGPHLNCPPDDPLLGVVTRILQADPHHLVFLEPDNFNLPGTTSLLTPVDLKQLVFNFHVYCGERSPVTGNPTQLSACFAQQQRSIVRHKLERATLGSPAQPAGPAWFLSEFGATSSSALLADLTDEANQLFLGWTYWAWKYYDDPTGSSSEGLVSSDGQLKPTAATLSQTYPVATAGMPLTLAFNPITGTFAYRFRADHGIVAPTVISVPVSMHYKAGYCARVRGGSVTSERDATHLVIRTAARARTVSVVVRPGRC